MESKVSRQKQFELNKLLDHDGAESHACFQTFEHNLHIRGFCRQVVEALNKNNNVDGMYHSFLLCGKGEHHFWGEIELWKRADVLTALTNAGFTQGGPASDNPCVSYHQWSVDGDKALVAQVLAQENA